jgi:hypothetical protein
MASESELLAASLKGSEVSTDNDFSLEASSLINEIKPTETIKEVPDKPAQNTDAPPSKKEDAAPVVKSWEEEFAERTGGKYKSWDEVEPLLAPKESEFADDEMRALNALKKQGVKFDKEFWEIQGKDFAGMKSPDEILLESMRRNKDYKGWTEKQLQLELDDKYRKREWSEEGEEPNEIEELMTARKLRDSENAREELIKLKDSLTIVKQPDPKAAEASQKAIETQRKEWKAIVESVSGKTSKLAVVVDDKTKESFDFDVSDSDRKEATEIMEQLGEDPLALFRQFKNAEGQYDNQAVYDAIVRFIKADDRVKVAYQTAKSKGAESEVKGLKNTNFKTDGHQTEEKKRGLAEALAEKLGYKQT